ncbi:hypothetical protein A1D31_30090 [Bradyrhizobium liaoningense]|nr:hypothetical protein A1D31_30090 [Bradyrhizobium liaoningense]
MDVIEGTELERLMASRDGGTNLPLNIDGLSPQTQKKIRNLIEQETVDKTRTWAWYQNLRKTDPLKYNKERRNMQRDAMLLGDIFKDGDWEDRNY